MAGPELVAKASELALRVRDKEPDVLMDSLQSSIVSMATKEAIVNELMSRGSELNQLEQRDMN